MISVKRIFVAGVVSLFIVLSSSYTGKATQQAPYVGCAQGLKEYLQAKKGQLNIESLSISNGVLDVMLACGGTVGSIIDAKSEYIALHPECADMDVRITTCLRVVVVDTLGYKGTARDGDKDPPYYVKFNTKIFVKFVYAEAKQLDIKLKGLGVKLMKDNKGSHFLQVSGEVSPLRGKQTVIDLMKKYAGGLNINAANLKEPSAHR
jgi:hypothetical protein